MGIELTRDSVAMGDDSRAPHLEIIEGATIGEVVETILSMPYLAYISGGKATWVVAAAGRPLAVVAEQWSEARYLVAPETAWEWKYVHVHFHGAHDPDEVFAELSAPGEHSPERRRR
ncbi:hypothetical protein AB0I28_06545 [Phytomonospora sp. NPDC050363]|uniref:hypothetical protein n=1 Tax=Phytomonospora sp. NPDC050363 TaxID=3155642 RepID=UPI0033C2D588